MSQTEPTSSPVSLSVNPSRVREFFDGAVETLLRARTSGKWTDTDTLEAQKLAEYLWDFGVNVREIHKTTTRDRIEMAINIHGSGQTDKSLLELIMHTLDGDEFVTITPDEESDSLINISKEMGEPTNKLFFVSVDQNCFSKALVGSYEDLAAILPNHKSVTQVYSIFRAFLLRYLHYRKDPSLWASSESPSPEPSSQS